MPTSDKFYYTENGLSGKKIVMVDPATLKKEILAESIPDNGFAISPTEDYAIFFMETEGPKEGDVHQILTPDDRQPAWHALTLPQASFSASLLATVTHG